MTDATPLDIPEFMRVVREADEAGEICVQGRALMPDTSRLVDSLDDTGRAGLIDAVYTELDDRARLLCVTLAHVARLQSSQRGTLEVLRGITIHVGTLLEERDALKRQLEVAIAAMGPTGTPPRAP